MGAGLFFFGSEMAVKTYAEQLASVQAAIEKIEAAGQSFDVDGRTTALAELETLYKRERYLRNMVAREGRAGPRFRQVVPRG